MTKEEKIAYKMRLTLKFGQVALNSLTQTMKKTGITAKEFENTLNRLNGGQDDKGRT